MKHRFYLSADYFIDDYINVFELEIIKQIINVLRAKHGDKFVFFNGDGFDYLGQLIESNKKSLKFLIIDKKINQRLPKNKITLYPSLLKSDKFEWVIQKSVELGVTELVPVVSNRCVVKNISPAKFERYQQIIKESAEQCGASTLPLIHPPKDFNGIVTELKNISDLKLIAWEEITTPLINDFKAPTIHLFIGPEGGYESEEINLAQANGFLAVSLGNRILRAETASIASLSVLLLS